MPVPDRVRDDGSGIQKPNALKKYWIPDQVRNDKRAIFAVLSIATQSVKRDLRLAPTGLSGLVFKIKPF